jgi:hypothetical protein
MVQEDNEYCREKIYTLEVIKTPPIGKTRGMVRI